MGISSLPAPAIQQFGEENGLTYPLLRDVSSVYSDYSIPGGQSPYPRDFIIDGNGIIQYANNEYDAATMVLIVQQLLDENCGSGDVNEDDMVDILDIVTIVSWIMGEDEINDEQMCIGDIDNNDDIDVLDIIILIDLIIDN